jgi:hypothetical protein
MNGEEDRSGAQAHFEDVSEDRDLRGELFRVCKVSVGSWHT